MTKLHDDHLLPAHGAGLRGVWGAVGSSRSHAVRRRHRGAVGLSGERGYGLSLVLHGTPLAL